MKGISLPGQKMSSLQTATVPTDRLNFTPNVYVLSYCLVKRTMDNEYLRKGENQKHKKTHQSWMLNEETILPVCCVMSLTNKTSLESLNSCSVFPNSSRLN